MKAALAKLKKQRRTGSGYRSFPYRESPSSDGRIRVREKEILYLESMRHEIWVHCEKKVFLTSETLGYWEEKLRVRSFLRVHKSFLVNMNAVRCVSADGFEMNGGDTVPIRQRGRSAICAAERRQDADMPRNAGGQAGTEMRSEERLERMGIPLRGAKSVPKKTTVYRIGEKYRKRVRYPRVRAIRLRKA